MPRTSTPAFETIADLLKQLGGIAPHRVRLDPPPGKATERDVIRILDHTNRRFELVDGTLVEKSMGFSQSSLAMWLGHLLQLFLDRNDLGFLAGESGLTRLMPGLVRMPDISYISWDQVPVRGEIPDVAISGLAPDLAIEVLSKSNTRKEMRRKLKEYFLAGVRRVWLVDPKRRTVEVFNAPDESVVLVEGQTLDGGDLLPGLALPLSQVFAKMPKQTPGGGRKSTRKPANRKSKKGPNA